MIVGVPREVKQDEYRVALIPVGAEELTKRGHRVLVERGAGLGSGILDDFGAVFDVQIVWYSAARSRATFDQHAMPGLCQFLGAERQQRDAILVLLDFPRNPDDHFRLLV